MLSQIEVEIKKILHKAGVEDPQDFSIPPKSEMGDVAFPLFTFSKLLGKNPAETAKDLEEKINNEITTGQTMIEKVKAFGPYLNFYLKPEKIAESVIGEVFKKKNNFGSSSKGKGKKTLIEYPSNNTHKEFHIGHFRNVCIGNTLVQLYSRSGYKIYPVNYLNDFGAHVARCLWGVLKFHSNEPPPENKQKWLGEIYAASSRYLKDHPEAATEVAEIQQQLEKKDKRIWPLFLKTRKWSIEKFDELFKELKVKHVAVFYEKDIKAKGQIIVDELLKRGIAKIGEGGAVIIDLASYNLDIALVRKSNGTGLYLTSDIPLAEEKFRKFNVDESIVITGQEQTFYFKQLYKILELIGFKKKLTHLSYGLVNLPEGKMSSRTGNVILYEDLRDKVYETMMNETKTRHPDWKRKKLEKTVGTLSEAALKFDMQKHEAIKNIVFDVREATAFEGFSGPYILYVVARINSIAEKAKEKKIKANKKFANLTSPEEKGLVLAIGEAENAISKALEQYNPSVIARYTFELAQAFNDFYNKCSIINAENAEVGGARLSLSLAAQQVIKNMLSILTIDSVEEM